MTLFFSGSPLLRHTVQHACTLPKSKKRCLDARYEVEYEVAVK